jgi:DNA mismatch repair ATPase MutS
MHTKPTNDNGFTYTYTIKPGISNIKGGFKVLQDMNYPEEMIKNNTKKSIQIQEDNINCEENEIRLEASLQ